MQTVVTQVMNCSSVHLQVAHDHLFQAEQSASVKLAPVVLDCAETILIERN